ncbi:hypothetical protein QM716_11235 [Rhodococcus sp. IEGM 1409]|uniref:hypothetical protein n=1 Tax=Rhodococcus sp. IEGM 1409 TaxID=3047082 RepID=UPI0024B86AD9|nr:hypothetical protein [Rhodococcus sp. IEGM 1409]MDI9900428.1 hypothetical protein [Rhodococcus sp. IEGM 1409]
MKRIVLGIAIPFVLMLSACGADVGDAESHELAFTCDDAYAFLEVFGTVEATLARLQSPGWNDVPELMDSASAWAAFTPRQQTAVVNSLHAAARGEC